VRIEELLDGDERDGSIAVKQGLQARGATPQAVLQSVAVTHVLEVRRRSAGDLAAVDRYHLYAHLWSTGRELARIDPSSAGSSGTASSTADEMLLPVEMDFPLTALWSVNRPGPALRLLALAP
jgi:hypothetical protein